MSKTWERIGEVAIDSAEMVIMDRMQLDQVPERGESEWLPHEYAKVETVDGIDLGAIVRTGAGDGTYPIEARVHRRGRRVADRRG